MPGLNDKLTNNENIFDRLARVEELVRELQRDVSTEALSFVPGDEGDLGKRIFTDAWLSLGWPPANVEKLHVYDGNAKIEGQGFEDVTGGTLYLQNKPSLVGATPADDDVGGLIRCLAINDANNPIIIGDIYFQITDVTEASEDSAIRFVTQKDYTDSFVLNLVRDRMGVNELAPERTVHIVGDDGGVGSFPGSLGAKDIVVVENNGNCHLALVSAANSTTQFKSYESGTAAAQGILQYNHNNDTWTIFTAAANRMTIGPGVQIGSPTGGDKGAGTLNANAVYDDNTLLTDWLFDLFFDGGMRPEDKVLHPNGRLWSIDQTYKFVEEKRHLPTMPGREEWEAEGSKSVGELVTALWETVESQQLQIFELKNELATMGKRLAALEAKA